MDKCHNEFHSYYQMPSQKQKHMIEKRILADSIHLTISLPDFDSFQSKSTDMDDLVMFKVKRIKEGKKCFI